MADLRVELPTTRLRRTPETIPSVLAHPRQSGPSEWGNDNRRQDDRGQHDGWQGDSGQRQGPLLAKKGRNCDIYLSVVVGQIRIGRAAAYLYLVGDDARSARSDCDVELDGGGGVRIKLRLSTANLRAGTRTSEGNHYGWQNMGGQSVGNDQIRSRLWPVVRHHDGIMDRPQGRNRGPIGRFDDRQVRAGLSCRRGCWRCAGRWS